MNNVILEEKYVLEYIRDIISDFKINSVEISNAKYHHNTCYSDAPSILKYGILSLSELNRLGIKQLDRNTLKILSDTNSHINGIDSISLSVVGLTDLYRNEDEYNPYYPTLVDFTISDDIKADRSTEHYGNEFICKDRIDVEKIKSVDIRLLRLIELVLNKDMPYINENRIKSIIDRYNCLKDIAISIKQSNLDIPFRDMSKENLTMDIDKISEIPKLILK